MGLIEQLKELWNIGKSQTLSVYKVIKENTKKQCEERWEKELGNGKIHRCPKSQEYYWKWQPSVPRADWQCPVCGEFHNKKEK